MVPQEGFMNQDNNAESLRLHVHKEPMKNPVVGEYFTVHVWLLDENTQLVRGKVIPLDVQLRLASKLDEKLVDEEELFVVTPTADFEGDGDQLVELPCIDLTGQVELNVKVNQIAPNGDSYVLYFRGLNLKPVTTHIPNRDQRIKNNLDGIPAHDLAPITSGQFRVVRFRLNNCTPLKSEWLRDPGGRRNHLEMNIDVHGKYAQVIRGVEVPVVVTLLYEDGDFVQDQGMLDIINPYAAHHVFVIRKSGSLRLEFRLLEVSRRHNNRRFVVNVQPDLDADPSLWDTCGCQSNPVRVLSKVNKHRQQIRDQKRKLKQLKEEGEQLELMGITNSPPTSRQCLQPRDAARDSVGAMTLAMLSNVAFDRNAKELEITKEKHDRSMRWCDHMSKLLSTVKADKLDDLPTSREGSRDPGVQPGTMYQDIDKAGATSIVVPDAKSGMSSNLVPVFDDFGVVVGCIRPNITFEFASLRDAGLTNDQLQHFADLYTNTTAQVSIEEAQSNHQKLNDAGTSGFIMSLRGGKGRQGQQGQGTTPQDNNDTSADTLGRAIVKTLESRFDVVCKGE